MKINSLSSCKCLLKIHKISLLHGMQTGCVFQSSESMRLFVRCMIMNVCRHSEPQSSYLENRDGRTGVD